MGDKAGRTKVGQWMTPDPVTIEDDATIMEAMHLLREHSFRRLPVMRRGRIAGVITEKMLLGYVPTKATPLDTWEVHYLLARTPVTEVMNPHPHTVRVDTEISDAAKLLRDRKLNGVIVTDDDGRLVGVFTTTNALEALIEFAEQPA